MFEIYEVQIAWYSLHSVRMKCARLVGPAPKWVRCEIAKMRMQIKERRKLAKLRSPEEQLSYAWWPDLELWSVDQGEEDKFVGVFEVPEAS